MTTRSAVIGSRIGLHARPAALFVQAASAADVPVFIAKGDGEPVSARSILSVLALDARGGDEVLLTADGEGSDLVLDQLVALLAVDHDVAEG
jgi:phosphocarrier protein HPr